MSKREKPVLLLGFGGHAKVLINTLKLQRREIIGALSKDSLGTTYQGVSVIGSDDALNHYSSDEVILVNAIGQLPNNDLRRAVYQKAKVLGFGFTSVIHPSAIIARDVSLTEDVQIMAGSIIEAAAVIGENVIINTGANINHGVSIGDHCHVAPGVVLCGNVQIGNNVFIGAASCAVPGITIADDIFIKANTLVKKNQLPK